MSPVAYLEKLGVGGLQHCIKATQSTGNLVSCGLFLITPSTCHVMQLLSCAISWDIILRHVSAWKASAGLPCSCCTGSCIWLASSSAYCHGCQYELEVLLPVTWGMAHVYPEPYCQSCNGTALTHYHTNMSLLLLSPLRLKSLLLNISIHFPHEASSLMLMQLGPAEFTQHATCSASSLTTWWLPLHFRLLFRHIRPWFVAAAVVLRWGVTALYVDQSWVQAEIELWAVSWVDLLLQALSLHIVLFCHVYRGVSIGWRYSRPATRGGEYEAGTPSPTVPLSWTTQVTVSTCTYIAHQKPESMIIIIIIIYYHYYYYYYYCHYY